MEVSGKVKEYGGKIAGETNAKDCEICRSDNITKQADGFCKECEEFMCNACFRQHLKAKLCRNHLMVDPSSRLSSPRLREIIVRCKQHNEETVKFYCRKHDVVGCGDCMVFEHKSCDAEYINFVSKDFHFSQEFQTLTSKIEQLTSMNKTTVESIQENNNKNQLTLEKTLGDIKQFRNDINTYLDKVEADVINEAKAIMSENERMLVKLEKECELLSRKIENTKQKLNVERFQDNELFINTVENKTTVQEIEREVAVIQSKRLRKYDFAPDEQLRNRITSRQRLGQLVTASLALIPQSSQKTQSENETVSVKKDTGIKSAGVVSVGTRVQLKRGYWARNGTVTNVHPDGTVDVKWDNIKKIRGPYNIGTDIGEVCPI